MANLAFDSTRVDPSQSFDPIPAGNYTAVIIESEMKSTKDLLGQYLELRFQVVDGPYNGRLVFDRLNLFNKNEKAAEIAQRNLSAICHAVNVLKIKDSVELHGKPMQIKVAVNPGDGAYGPSNDIKGYKSLKEADAAPAPQKSILEQQQEAQATPPATNQKAAANAVPW